MNENKDHQITVICTDSFKTTGILKQTQLSPLGALQWLEIETKKGIVQLNARFIISITRYHAYISTDREGNKDNRPS